MTPIRSIFIFANTGKPSRLTTTVGASQPGGTPASFTSLTVFSVFFRSVNKDMNTFHKMKSKQPCPVSMKSYAFEMYDTRLRPMRTYTVSGRDSRGLVARCSARRIREAIIRPFRRTTRRAWPLVILLSLSRLTRFTCPRICIGDLDYVRSGGGGGNK